MSVHLLIYEYVPDMLERRGPYREAHLARIQAERAAGRVDLAGAIGDPPHGGAIVWRDTAPEEIEAFVRADPYMQAGLITSYRIDPWNLV